MVRVSFLLASALAPPEDAHAGTSWNPAVLLEVGGSGCSFFLFEESGQDAGHAPENALAASIPQMGSISRKGLRFHSSHLSVSQTRRFCHQAGTRKTCF